MKEILELRNRAALLSLDELVEQANALLSRVLPEVANGRQNALNPRLVRHLATLGLLDEPRKMGREARYGARHLLQLLVVRRLMAEGLTTGAIKNLLRAADDAQLEAILDGGARLALDWPREAALELFEAAEAAPELSHAPIAGSNAALDYLGRIKARASPPAPSPQISAPKRAPQTASRPPDSRWTRLEVVPGLELHLRADFRAPTTPHERALLLQRVEEALKNRRKSL